MIFEPILQGQYLRDTIHHAGCGRTFMANRALAWWQSRMAPRHHDFKLADITGLARDIRRTWPCASNG